MTAAAGFDNYVAKSKDWPSLVSLTRDRVKLPLPLDYDTDALILRWGNGFLNQDLINKLGNRTLVLGVDDMNYFTGACHYAGDCTGFHESCSNCPCVRGSFRKIVSENLERKKRLLGQVKNLKVVAPTQWIKEEFEKSSFVDVADVHLISNPLDPIFFEAKKNNYQQRVEAQTLKVLIVAADLDDPIKGILSSWPFLKALIEKGKIRLILAGQHSKNLRDTMQGAEFLGHINATQLISAYREVDLLLVPSIREAAGLIVSEAATQGTPSLVRRIGGLPNEVGSLGGGWLFDNNFEIQAFLENVTGIEINTHKSAVQKSVSRRKPMNTANDYLKFIEQVT